MPLKKMKGQRRSHHVGDVFALRLEDSAYRFGRIVKIGESGPRGRFPGGILAYLYDVPAEAPEPDPAVLTPDRLLMPPFFTMNWAWDKGYFRTVTHEDLDPTHLLKRHCFYDASIDGYVDENDDVLPRRVEPCGWFALTNFEHFQHEVDEAIAGRPVYGAIPKK
ncbi:immunity 26/phosphotriesterase HocA family protein [Streptomyces phaeochromogenes]|uniref:Immunity 26/phosphotriesterase HocA family protein n=1 Tax=Streptomyces phaeochromogenes TaxID=1923 RepID=A0ABZ1HU69_STRPH|nr:Imm26 family immunity protein [Streptomyces phaeochromogenes]WSD21051.1 immunity 26/phosphotriesterase HocA family protein [Streptomyces phaeochromogenes]